MEIGILYCEDCFFSQRAHAQLTKALTSIVGKDRQKLNLKFQSYDIKGIEATKFNRAKTQILIISQYLMDRIRRQKIMRKEILPLNKILRPKRVIAVLLNVEPEEVNSEYFSGCEEWQKLCLKSSNKMDSEFYKKFSDHIVKLYNLELSSSISFSVFPKKVTRDQPKVILLFKHELKEDDRVYCELTRGKESQSKENLEVMKSNPYAGIIRIPASLCQEKTSLIEITVFVNGEKLGTKLVKYDLHGKHTEEDVISRMNLAIPGFRKVLDDHVSSQLSKNYRSCEDSSLDSSLELMNDTLICRGDDFPTVMHFAANYGLEQSVCVLLYEGDGLEQISIKNDVGETPIDIANDKGYTAIAQNIKEFYELNTTFESLQYIKDLCLLHTEELQNISVQLNDTTAEEANGNLEAENDASLDKNELSESNHGAEFEQTNPEYVSVNDGDQRDSVETVEIRVESIETEDLVIEFEETENSYMSPEAIYANTVDKIATLQSYDVPPPPVMLKPPTLSNNYDVPRRSMHDYCIPQSSKHNANSTTPVQPVLSVKSSIAHSSDGYICMHNNDTVAVATLKLRPVPPVKPIRAKPPVKTGQSENFGKYPAVTPPVIQFPSAGLSKKGFLNTAATSPLPLTKQFSLDPTQEELLELMNDFKKNVYNIRELELLYENWKQRHDVQMDYKIRQKELKDIQKEYQKIQEKIRRENTKKQGPMAKLLKFMPGSRKKHWVPNFEQSGSNNAPDPPPAPDEPNRKTSGSSDGNSAISESSGPDSGVSDPDLIDQRSSYVGPSQIQPTLEDVATNPDPPARPPKKPSISSYEAPALLARSTPPRTPKISTEKTPILEELNKVSCDPSSSASPVVPAKKQSVTEPVHSLAPPPPPPPRVHKPESPFSYIDYKGKAKGLLGMTTLALHLDQSDTQLQCIQKPEKRVKSSYENEIEQKK